MIKQRDVLHYNFQTNADICNELFQIDNRLSLKEGEKHLQQSTLVLRSVGNKMPVQESAKVKEKVTKKLGKEGMGSTSASLWFPKGTWQWRRYLVKSQCK